MKVVALLPMNGNSERVPNKNLKDFCGRPLYHRILNTLLDSKYINEIVVNTECARIKEDLMNNYQGKVIIHDRPDETIGDFVSMNKIIRYDIDKVEADLYVQTHSTNPMLKTETLDNAIKNFLEKRDYYDSMFSVTRVQKRLYGSDGSPLNHDPVTLLRTQDLPPIYEENSNFYIFTKMSFNNANSKRIGQNALMYEIDRMEAKNIDELNDFITFKSLFIALG